jgi:hypothetical protein
MNWTLSKLKQEDWDFRKCSNDDLWACHRYEYQREDEALIKAVIAYRKQNPDFPQKYLETLKPYDPEEEQRSFGALGINTRPLRPPFEATLPPEWPDQSFFSPLGKPKIPGIKFHGKRRHLLELYEVFLDGIVRYWNDNDFSFGKGGAIWDSDTVSEVRAFRISWRYSDADLLAGFSDWLKENRPQGDEWDYRPKVEILKWPTGGKSEGRNLRPELKALGAYRLLLCYKGNRYKAVAHSTDDSGKNILGKNFAHESAWTEARDLAIKTIKNVAAPFDFTKIRLKPKSK